MRPLSIGLPEVLEGRHSAAYREDRGCRLL